jgi:hypothetical protein
VKVSTERLSKAIVYICRLKLSLATVHEEEEAKLKLRPKDEFGGADKLRRTN